MQNQYYWALTDEEYIAHHGILGQKWGIRRYQNPDGSLTPEGRSRIQNHDSKTIRSIAKNRTSNMYKNMSESDLAKRRKVLGNLEEAYDKYKNAPDTTSKKDLQKLKSDVNKTSEAVNKIRQSDIKKNFKDMDLDDYYIRRDIEAAFDDVSSKYTKSSGNSKVKSALKSVQNIVVDTITDPRIVGSLDTIIRTSVYNAVR